MRFIIGSIVLLLLGQSASAQDTLPYKAGTATKIITPSGPLWMSGYGARNKECDTKHHDLWVKALAIEDAVGNVAILLTSDLCGIPRSLAEEVTSDVIKKTGLNAYAIGACANGALMFYSKPVRNYRDWHEVDAELWEHYWLAMVNRGVLAQPYWWDEQWTLSVAHTEADIDKHLSVFAEIAPALAQAQQERSAVTAHSV